MLRGELADPTHNSTSVGNWRGVSPAAGSLAWWAGDRARPETAGPAPAVATEAWTHLDRPHLAGPAGLAGD